MRARLPILLLLMCAVLAETGCWDPPKTNSWNNATGAEQFERLLSGKPGRALLECYAFRMITLRFLILPLVLFCWVLADGARAEDAAAPRIGRISVADGNAALNTMNLRGTYQRQPLELKDTRMMTVWQQVKGGWVAIAHADSIQ